MFVLYTQIFTLSHWSIWVNFNFHHQGRPFTVQMRDPRLKVIYGLCTGLDIANGMDGATSISSQKHNEYLCYQSTDCCSLSPSIDYSVVDFKQLEINTFLVVIRRFLFVHRAHQSHEIFLVNSKEPMYCYKMHLLLQVEVSMVDITGMQYTSFMQEVARVQGLLLIILIKMLVTLQYIHKLTLSSHPR